jgi:endonuclease-3 related protein
MKKPSLNQLYLELLDKYHDPANYWPQWCAKKKTIGDREKITIGMILVQRTSWHNANIALKNLKNKHLLSIKKIGSLKSLTELIKLIRSAGFYRSKPCRLFDICRFVVQSGGVEELLKCDISQTRQQLLNIKGVGPETADTILLYALDKPVFIIDEYTRRWAKDNNLSALKNYDQLQKFFQKNLKPNLITYQNLHALIIICQRGQIKSQMEII